MTIADKLTEDMKASMKAGQADRTAVLRLLRGAMKNEEIKTQTTLDEPAMLKVLQREAKQRRDSIEAYRTAGRPELEAQEAAELEIIATYLPEAMSEAEIKQVVDEVAGELGAGGPAATGAVIGRVMARVGARADGATVSRLVRERLAQVG